ncbi:hypothetical protein D0T90_02640 [Neisseria animalis]|uniref:Uncharacterized protein n=3 Tax=Neisseriales TaxID=206351 RepID=A0A378US90_BERDE|nr:hypothetical protein D0T90_02640 [Neisseria animalis]STZ74802.1 Uncharacterised protein [Bergeriella denitrificans]ROW32134.1 hypothetical protein CGZ60_06020 [Neisseria animalis]STZ76090.1 Uncharacterised protein [Bergeriella denitrificans]STZ77508.1 Uncharacterised protein [Bergeriella denitrificans]
MKIERDYGRIKAKVWRERSGCVCCELSDTQGVFILLLVSADALEEEADVVAQALRCLSSEDLRKAA